MPCSTPHDFPDIACSSALGSLPAPFNSRSITNFGIAFSLVVAAIMRRNAQAVLSPMSGAGDRGKGRRRDNCPGSAHGGRRPAQAGVAREHNGLVAMLDADLVQDARDVIAHRLFG